MQPVGGYGQVRQVDGGTIGIREGSPRTDVLERGAYAEPASIQGNAAAKFQQDSGRVGGLWLVRTQLREIFHRGAAGHLQASREMSVQLEFAAGCPIPRHILVL